MLKVQQEIPPETGLLTEAPSQNENKRYKNGNWYSTKVWEWTNKRKIRDVWEMYSKQTLNLQNCQIHLKKVHDIDTPHSADYIKRSTVLRDIREKWGRQEGCLRML